VVWWRSSSAWGAPEVHEDDAERAVRAGLAIAAAAETEVRVSPVSDLGQGMVVGDVMNTASRLQPVAPVGRVDAGEATFRATRAVIDYESLPPVMLKQAGCGWGVVWRWRRRAPEGFAARSSGRRSWVAAASCGCCGLTLKNRLVEPFT
jgi:class 3 adenylate cyclase